MKYAIVCFLISLIIVSCRDRTSKAVITAGVPDSLAVYRKTVLKDIRYALHFQVPGDRTAEIPAKETITFSYAKKNSSILLLDFKEAPGKIKKLIVNSQSVAVVFEQEHIFIDGIFLKNGINEISIDFIAGNAALNRREDFMYTLFVPDRARTVFPCFDQPDLKAFFKLSLTIPKDWAGITNSTLVDSAINGATKTLNFAATDKLPTYLFSFAAGKFSRTVQQWRNKNIELFYRETDKDKIANSLPAIFDLYKKSVLFCEQWTGIPFPFQKHGMVAIPDFQFGGMEHPGAILLQNASLFLGKEATEGQINNRAQLMAHEVAHMWFGDLVTMSWFTDVWMKEVFANFIADKANAKPKNKQGFALQFLTTHLPYAYATDRTPGANPIRQPLDNLENAGTLYGNIIYHKAPVMMRQLEELMGASGFQRGVREYLEKYRYSNAAWPDLISILAKYTSADLNTWNAVWVNEPGRPVIDYTAGYENGQISNFTIRQKPERGRSRVWRQFFDISFYYPGLVRSLIVNDSLSSQELPRALQRKQPLFIQFNASGTGYGVWPVDTAMYPQLFTIENYVSRASAYINLYENMLNGRYKKADELLELFASGLQQETIELNLQLLTNYINTIYWNFLAPGTRKQLAGKLEQTIWKALQKQKRSNTRKILFKCYQDIFETMAAQQQLYEIWRTQKPPALVVLKEEDYTSLAFALVLRKAHPGLLQQQLQRIENPDRKKRFELIMPALSFDTAVRTRFFNSLLLKENRTNESAVGAALAYLHHPLRQPSAEQYLNKTLELLPQIQKTGDIFFPGNWLQSSFGSYQSKSVYAIVQNFMQTHQGLKENLKQKILQQTDNLRRAQSITR